jgi:hypothetical protein
MPDEVALTRSYPAGRNAAATAQGFAALAPEAKIKVAGGKVWVRGFVEDHERIAAPRQSAEVSTKRPPSARAEKKIEHLEVREKPVGKVLEQLALNLNFELRMDRAALTAAGISLDQRVSVKLDNAKLDDVLRELLKTTRLQYEIKGVVVEIAPR